ncbi:MAG TPA: GNAT family N-acetyltransferase [Kofleriaceae bacterium]|jgi:ribosomal protein S18 acetylase RimI-like enzyme|nr:GNAT family N-acetyltransferase [Kofleriaceae bacterium]
MTDLTLRTAVPDDAPALAAFAERVFRDTFGPHNRPEDMDAYCATAYAVDHVRHELTDRAYHTLLAVAGGAFAGYAQLRTAPPPPCVVGPAPLELKRLYVDHRWHGGGVARALIDRAIAIAEQRGACTLYLSVWRHNQRAIAFYAKHGFVAVGTSEFTLGTDVQIDPVMVRPLAAGPARPSPSAADAHG